MSKHPFVEQVLALRPRVAVFDCDGTLWTNNSGDDFLYWSIETGLVSKQVAGHVRARHEDYKRGNVDETEMCGEMTSMYAGLSTSELEAAAAKFYEPIVRPNIFPEMQQLTFALRDAATQLWAISSTNEWVVQYGAAQFGIPPERVLAAKVVCSEGRATGELIRVPSGEGKAVAIREFIGGQVDAVFGNSIHDLAMLELASHPFAVNPNPDLEQIALARKWTIYWPEKTLTSAAR
jgi:HAD superfamily hydrolase (TIGR01490 family)